MSDEGLSLAVDLAPQNPFHLRLSNPIMIASGTFGYDGYGRGLTPEMQLSKLGGVIPKTVTRLPREGNPEPRWYPNSFREAREAGECIYLNSIGLANPGIEDALTELVPQWAKWGATVVRSLAAESVTQFGEMAAMTHGVDGFQAIELNLSCPNVDDGALFGYDAQLAAAVTAAVRANTELPLLVKLAPNVPDITLIAKSVVYAGADALTISNTLPAMTIDVEQRKPVLGGVTGGLSGPGLRAVALALVYRVVQAVDVPVIGVGGIFTANDALEYILAGATAVQIGSANLADLWAPFNILEELRVYLEQRAITDINQLIGAAQAKAPVP